MGKVHAFGGGGFDYPTEWQQEDVMCTLGRYGPESGDRRIAIRHQQIWPRSIFVATFVMDVYRSL